MPLINLFNWTTRIRIGLITVLALVISGCGGGGGGGSPPVNDPNRVGAGWITITGNSAGPTNSTNLSYVGLSGEAFISPKWSSCCTWTGSDSGVTVSWANATTGNSGTAFQETQYGLLIFLVSHKWSASVDLAVGSNVITMTATDKSGNLGRVTTTVTRTPDLTPPVVQATNPNSGASVVGTNSAFSVTFNEAMDSASISAATILLKDNSNNAVNGGVAYSNRVATFTPATNLQGTTSYTASVTTGVTDVAGNSLAVAYSWSFTTGPAPDVTAPTISSTSPSSGATCVQTESGILATFSKAVKLGTVNPGTFLLKDSQNNPVDGTAMLDYLGQATFNPSSTLANFASYTGTLTTGLTDLAGNHLAADYTWTFTTQPAGSGPWTATAAKLAPLARSKHTAVWTGRQMIVWGGSFGSSALGDGARYDPASDTWTPLATVDAPSARFDHVAVWTGSKMLVWGGVQPGAYLSSGAIYDPATDSWTAMSSSGAPSARQSPTAVWTGTEMIIWGGNGGGGNDFLGDGARYNPTTDSWSPVSASGAPAARYGHTAVWTGSTMLVWGGGVANVGSMYTNAGAVYTPTSNTWTSMSTTGAPVPRRGHVAVWTGNEMLVWGGWDATGSLAAGARFNPSAKLWQAVSSTCAPLARYGHIGAWSGTELLVWGGGNANGPYYRVGGRYNPNTDTWQATPVTGMPSGRVWPTGIWTGTDLIVWGGSDLSVASLNSGGRYLPN